MQANHNLLKCVVSAETLLGPNSTLVLHHALVWITEIMQNEQLEHTGFVYAKIVYTSADFTKHSDMTAEKWDQLKEVVIPLQPLMSKEGGVLIRSAVDLIASPIKHTPPHTFVCASKTCYMGMCMQARRGALSHAKGPRIEEGDGDGALVGSEAGELESPNPTVAPTVSPSVAAIEAEEGEAADIAHTSAAAPSALLGEVELDEMEGHSEEGVPKTAAHEDVDQFFNNDTLPDVAVHDNPAAMALESRSTGKRKKSADGIPSIFEGPAPEKTLQTTGMNEEATDFCAAHSGQSLEAGPGILSSDSSQTSASTLREAMLISMSSTEMLEIIKREQKTFFAKHFADLQAANSTLVAANAALVAERSDLMRTQAATQKRLQDAENRLQSAKNDTDEIQKKYSSLQQNMQKGYEQAKITMDLLRPVCNGKSAGSAVPSLSVLDTGFARAAPPVMGSAASLVATPASTLALGSKLTSTSVNTTTSALAAPSEAVHAIREVAMSSRTTPQSHDLR